jgi:hypothetical protein
MSVDLVVYLNRNKMLSPLRWADAIRAAGFAVGLDVDFDVDSHTGFLPCREASVVAAAVLAHETGGLLHDPQADETIEPDRVLAWAREQLAEITSSSS